MITKRFFLSVAACGLLALSNLGFANAAEGVQTTEDGAFYVKAFYNGAKVLKRKEIEKAGTKAGKADDYEPEYELGKLGGGAALGYYISGVRAELEGLLSGLVEPKSDSKEFFLGHATDGTGGKSFKHKGFSHISGFINGYYDIALSDIISPYIGAGVGVSYATLQTEEASKTEKEKALHIALQGKAGVNFSVNDMFVPYVGYKFLYMMPKEYTIKESAAPTDTATAQEDVKVSHMLHNLEAGIMIPMSV